MPDVRYYDYGVMRREADRRMYDVQRHTHTDGVLPVKRIICDHSQQARPEYGPQPTCTQDAPESVNVECAGSERSCEEQPLFGKMPFNAEDMLIISLLLLALSESGSNIPLALVLLYLLI